MRPVRALVGLALIVGLWLWWRAPAVLADLDRYSAAAHLARARAAQAEGEVTTALHELRIALAEEPANAAARALWRALAFKRPARMPSTQIAAVTPPPAADREPLRRRLVTVVLTRRPAAAPAAVRPSPTAEGMAAADAPVSQKPVPPAASVADATLTPSPAEAAYASLAAGDKRNSARAFRQALAQTPRDPRAEQWRRQLVLLEKRWSGSVYTHLRDDGIADLATTAVLGGGQSGGQLFYALDPLAPRPLALEARLTAPNNRSARSAQAAFGIAWKLTPRISVTAERLIRIGAGSRNAWTLRAAGGVERSSLAVALDAYAEGGFVGIHDPATYVAAQGHIARPIILGNVKAAIGVGTWASVQHDARTVSRFEIGPSLRLRHGALDLSADYRLRLAGNAAPGSGPAVTIAAYF